MRARRALGVIAAAWLAGCGGRCPEIAAVKQSLLARTEIAPGPHAQVRIPLGRANAFLAELLRDQPLAVPIELPSLGPIPLTTHALTAVAREVRLRPAPPDRLRFAMRIELDDAQQPVTTLALEAEVTPQVVRDHGATELVAGFGPENLVALAPVLDAGSAQALGDAVSRWLPPAVRDRLPRDVVDRAAAALGSHLTGAAYHLLQTTLLRRLGEVTRLRVRLPALPITRVALRSNAAPDAPDTEALTIDLTTELPVRGGLAAAPPAPALAPALASDEIAVRISGSTAAELANWSIDHGHLPPHYTRDLEPRADGEFRPWLDYLAGDRARPFKIHVFQERGGCSYFRVGLRLELQLAGDQLEVATLDRIVETADASALLEAALWIKQLIQGSVDQSRRAAAHTQLTLGGRTFTTRAVGAAVADGELRFALRLSSERPAQATQPVVR